jgi:uncharacterized coiled-coil DUF342 family protein
MIFLHSSFRVSSTWLWSRFRRADRVVAYCEVFNERLATIARTELNTLGHDAWYSKHPAGAGYFLEFLPLIQDGGGVSKFDPAMAFDRFIPADGVRGRLGEAEQVYLASLIGRAEALDRIPVLSETRSLGRLRAIKAEFPGLHILIYRNLFQQWCSYSEQLFHNNPYFFNTIRWTIEASLHDPFCRYLRDVFPLEAHPVDSTNYFCCFILLHLYLYAQAADAADLIIDTNHLAGSSEYRLAIEQQIAETTAVAIDLSSIRNSIAFSFLTHGRLEELMDRLKPVADLAIAGAPSAQGRDFAGKALTDLVEEYTRYEFYAGALAAVAGPRGLLGERDGLAADRDGLRGERDGLAADRDGLRGERDGLAAERDGLRAERDGLRAERDGLAVERDGLRAERDGLRVERDGLHAERDGLRAERDSLRLERDGLCAERDSLRTERDGLRAARDGLRAERDGLRAERDGLRAERDSLAAERDRLADGLASMLRSTSWRITAPIRALRNLF